MQNSSSSKTIGIIIVIIIIVLGIWLMTRKAADNGTQDMGQTPTTGDTSGAATANQQQPAQASQQTPTMTSGNSDADLTQDSAAIDTQMQGLGADTSAASQTPQ